MAGMNPAHEFAQSGADAREMLYSILIPRSRARARASEAACSGGGRGRRIPKTNLSRGIERGEGGREEGWGG